METLRRNLRIIGAIMAKDIVDALKNKNTLSIILSVLFIVVFYRLLPGLENDGTPDVLIYDAGASMLTVQLENSAQVDAYTYPSQERMEWLLTHGDVPELGLVIPADFDQAVAAGDAPVLQGYVLRWVSETDAAALKRTVETHIAELTGTPARIELTRVTPRPDSEGLGVSAGFAILFVILMIGVTFIPHLMLEEKRAQTLDALLVSPAGAVQVALGKALSGAFYGLLGVSVALALNYALVVQWWLMLLALFCGILFTVTLGLFLGMQIESRQQLMLWAQLIVLPLLLPVFMALMTDLFPAWLIQAFQYLPTVALFNIMRVAFSGEAAWGLWLPRLALLGLWTAAFLALTAWRLSVEK